MEIDEQIDSATEALGVDLAEWQREWLRAYLDGQAVVAYKGRRGGWTTMQDVVKQVRLSDQP